MDVIAPLAPSPGAAAPGNLYTDLQSRTLWLGVDLAVNPSGSVLISDIVGLQAADTANLTTAKSYTDTQITTRAPTVHTHTSSQITDFAAAVTAVATGIPSLSYTRGMIMMYSGSLADIGVGPLAGWALCNGSNGTPDLRDKFVYGAGNKIIGSVNPNASAATDNQGDHTHVIAGTVLSTAQMPNHSHGGSTGYVSTDHSHAFSANTGGRSAGHSHNPANGGGFITYAGSGGNVGSPTGGSGLQSGGGTTTESADHYHGVSGNTGGISANHYHAVNAEGGGGSHAHTAANAGTHQHSTPSANLRDAIPYYALAFIMKT